MSNEHSVSQWIASLKAGEAEAAQQLWERFRVPLIQLAARRLKDAPKRISDEDDIAQSVFLSLCHGAAAGRFEDVRNRDDLWWLLLATTRRKVVDFVRRETAKKRGAGHVVSEGALSGKESGKTDMTFDDLIGDAPSPDLLVMLAEEHHRLLNLLRDDRLRKIAVSRIEGYSVVEIAADLEVSTRSVERKLRLIRDAWAEELFRAE